MKQCGQNRRRHGGARAHARGATALVLVLGLFHAPLTLALNCDANASFARAVHVLVAAPAAARVAFVEAATAALAARYHAAASSGRDDASWARGARDYSARLATVASAARAGGEVRLLNAAEGLRVIVGTRPARQFVLTPPRPAERAALEREVLQRLCNGMPAGDAAAEPALVTLAPFAAAARPVAGATPPGRADGVVATLPAGPDGLDCGVPEGRHARLWAAACAPVLAEVRALVAALHACAMGGTLLDWTVLAAGDWRARGQRLVVTVAGDAVTVDAPLLGRFPALYDAALPWIRARLGGHARALALEPPARLVYAPRSG